MDDYLYGMTDAEKQLYQYCKNLENDKFIVFPNLMIERRSEGTNQYDLILLTDRGIFVVEYKDYSGAIYGNEFQKEWIAYYKGGKKVKFRNPVKQNENHIKTLNGLLFENNIHIPVHNLIVFGDSASLNKIESSVYVIKKEQISEVISLYPQLVMHNDDLKNYLTLVANHNITSDTKRMAHIEYASSFANKIPFLNSAKVLPEFDVHSDNAKVSHNSNFQNDNAKALLNSSLHNDNAKVSYKSDYHHNNANVAPKYVPQTENSSYPNKWRGRYYHKRKSRKSVLEIIRLSVILIVLVSALIIGKFSNINKQKPAEITKSAIINVIEDKNKDENKDENIEENKDENIEENKDVSFQNNKEVQESSIAVSDTGNEEVNQNVADQEIVTGKENADSNNSVGEQQTADNSSIILEKLDIGISQELVKQLFGEPTQEIEKIWYYSSSAIMFNEDGNVAGWNNNGQLNNRLYVPIPGAKKLDIGLTKKEVRDLMGSPSIIEVENPGRWFYTFSTVTFDENGKVAGWLNNGALNNWVYAPITGAEKLDIGLTKSEVRDLMGSPSIIEVEDPDRWFYNFSTITFDENGKVAGWMNNGALNNWVYAPIPGAKKLDIGLTKVEVRDLMGSPSIIEVEDPDRWFYNFSTITFDDNGKVSKWVNNGQFDTYLDK